MRMFNWMKARLNVCNTKDLGDIARDRKNGEKANHDLSMACDAMAQKEEK